MPRRVFKTVRTGMYGRTAADVLDWTIDAVRRGDDFWTANTFVGARTSLMCDGEVAIEFTRDDDMPPAKDDNGLLRESSEKTAGRFADMLKRHIMETAGEWKRDSGKGVCAFTVSDACAVYDALKGGDICKSFPAAVVERVAGRQRDPATTEIMLAYKKETDRLDAKKYLELDRFRNMFRITYMKLRTELEQLDYFSDDAFKNIRARTRDEISRLEREYSAATDRICKKYDRAKRELAAKIGIPPDLLKQANPDS